MNKRMRNPSYDAFITLFLSFSLFFLLTRCDIVTSPYEQPNSQVKDTTTNNEPIVQKVLVEDLTGYLCGNCPEAAAEAQRLKALYGDRIVTMAVHGGYFARPDPQHPLDLRCAESEEIINYFNVILFPSGLVNRRSWEGTRVLAYSSWQAAVDSFLKEPPRAQIQITPTYTPSSRQVQATVKVTYLQDGSIDDYLAVYITEDSIIGYQKDYTQNPPYIENYVHRHVLRGSLNGTWGEALSPESPPRAYSTLTKNFTYTLPSTWNAAHCSLVAILHDNKTREIIQVEEVHLIDTP